LSDAELKARKRIHSGRVFDFEVHDVLLPTGVAVSLEVILHPGAAAILPLTEDGEILLLRQYRYAAGGEIWEIPAGTREPGEELLHCARRELLEEAGVAADAYVDLGDCLPLAAYSTERIRLFLARGLHPEQQNLEADEVITEVVALPVARVGAMILSGEIEDAKTITAFSRAQLGGWLPSAATGARSPTPSGG
jgi:ADP-ribose pyrophosphatase